jgi:multicomponent Na+:H+ antiporter subunit D
MGIGAFLCTLFGIFPGLLYQYLPHSVDYHPYNAYHLVETTQILLFTFIGFWILRKKLEGEPKIALDFDWLYRRPAGLFWSVFVTFPDRVFTSTEQLAYKAAGGLTRFSKNPMYYFKRWSGSQEYNVVTDGFSTPIHAALGFILVSIIIVSILLM